MSHRQYIHARPCGKGEWVAEIKEGKTILATGYGLSRRAAIYSARKKIGPEKRFIVKWDDTRNTYGKWFEVIDKETDQVYTASAERDDDAVEQVERQLPRAYFQEQPCHHGYHSTKHTWKDYHFDRFLLIPVAVVFIIGMIIIQFG